MLNCTEIMIKLLVKPLEFTYNRIIITYAALDTEGFESNYLSSVCFVYITFIFIPKNLKDILMNKSELVDSIAKKSGLSKAQSTEALNAFIATIGEAMKANDTVSLVGFGTFSVKERQARTGRNPQTKEEIQIPASKVPSFKAGKSLKDMVN